MEVWQKTIHKQEHLDSCRLTSEAHRDKPGWEDSVDAVSTVRPHGSDTLPTAWGEADSEKTFLFPE